jgi:hypothetical protein
VAPLYVLQNRGTLGQDRDVASLLACRNHPSFMPRYVLQNKRYRIMAALTQPYSSSEKLLDRETNGQPAKM